jgi:nucleotide-binding universal stress UspA family protein
MKILLAVDESKFSEAAVKMLIMQNQPSSTTVRVLHVVEPIERPYYPDMPPYPASMADIDKGRERAGRDLARQIAGKLRAAGFKADASVVREHARPAIVDAAAKWHADLIMVGSHGRRGVERLLLGSVSDYVARHASCSVQIVRPRKRK